MKQKLLRIGLGIVGISPAFAIEPPPDNSPPPPSVEAGAARRAPAVEPSTEAAATREAPAFLGLISKAVPDMLSAHLGLEPGQGVIISGLVPGGPAEKAGFEQHDIIRRLAGSPVNSPAELSECLSAHKAGDEIEIDLIHKGEETRRTVTLGARPADNRAPHIADASGRGGIDLDNFGNFTPSQLDRIRKIIDGNLQFPERIEMGQVLQPNLDERIREMQELMSRARDFDPGDNDDSDQPGQGAFSFKSSTTLSIADDQGSIEIRSRNGKKSVNVRDAENNTVWSGPWNTEEDKAKAPADIRERVEKLNLSSDSRGNGFHFRFGD